MKSSGYYAELAESTLSSKTDEQKRKFKATEVANIFATLALAAAIKEAKSPYSELAKLNDPKHVEVEYEEWRSRNG